MKLSACIEWLYAPETANFADRIWLARQSGLAAVEFWRWTDKDLDSIDLALQATEMELSSIVAEPMISLTDIRNQSIFLEGLRRSIATARRLGAPVLIAQAGDELSDVSRHDQKKALVETLNLAGEMLKGSGVRIGLEPLNTLIDHPGYFLPSTVEALEIAAATGRPEIGIVYDIYHSAVMGEETEVVIGGNIDRVFHIHIADHPGRNEPGTGGIDLKKRLDWLLARGYSGFIGLEYRPVAPTSKSVDACRRVLSQ
ncbi:TIM barrel protein [Mesorhizobium sp. AR02]|uniref:TIM barrel protein n=1 Tax=Mesorhizobium sp. AR02 TaxID=2865837 RepID=UPI00215F08D6|nr:TIM barrel protein [Mesorhizobium sp. AR02]UVK54567.1 TIM barrel protein [Mesorhizobium sp. AR02]